MFLSFHYDFDYWRTQQVRKIGTLENDEDLKLSINEWESIRKKSNKKIKEWIDNNLHYRSCTIVLIGEETAHRKWVRYEIEKSWNGNKGLFGIYIHNLKDNDGKQSKKGKNPFDYFRLPDGEVLSSVVECYNPPSNDAYNSIKENIEEWVKKAIENRNQH